MMPKWLVDKNTVETQMLEAGGCTKKCPGCGGQGIKRCTGCYLALYCSKDCQRKDWKEEHKVKCKKVRAEFREVVLALITKYFKQTEAGKRARDEKLGKPMAPVSKDHFEVFVWFSPKLNTCHIYNEDRIVDGILTRSPGSENIFDKMKEVVGQKGIGKEMGFYCGYFYAIYKGAILEGPKTGGHKLEINMDRRLALEEIW